MAKIKEDTLDLLGQKIQPGEFCVAVQNTHMHIFRVISVATKSVKLEHFDSNERRLRAEGGGNEWVLRPPHKIVMLQGDQQRALVMLKLSAE